MKLLRLRSGVVGVACAMVVGSQLAAVEVPAGFFVDIVASGPPLDRPIGLQANPDGTFFVTDLGPDALTNSAVLLMTTSGQLSSVFSGTPLVTPIDAQRPPAGSPFGSALFISDQDSFGGFGALFRQNPMVSFRWCFKAPPSRSYTSTQRLWPSAPEAALASISSWPMQLRCWGQSVAVPRAESCE